MPLKAHPALRRFALTLLTSLLVSVLMLLLYISQPPLLHQIDQKIYDAFLTSRVAPPPSTVPVLVDIDENSLARYGQWPWPRYLVARLIENLSRNGAASVALDILLAEADRSSPKVLRQQLRRDFGAELDLGALPQQLVDNDVLLAETLAQSPSVLGIFMQFKKGLSPPSPLPKATALAEQTPAGAPSPRETSACAPPQPCCRCPFSATQRRWEPSTWRPALTALCAKFLCCIAWATKFTPISPCGP